MFNADRVIDIAHLIGSCDFRVTIQLYVTQARAWVITVGESDWQRHIVPNTTAKTLGILSVEQSKKFGFEIDTNDVIEEVTLDNLIAGGYSDVRKKLKPE